MTTQPTPTNSTREVAMSASTSPTVSDIATGDRVRAWVGNNLVLIGTEVRVTADRYDGYYGVELKPMTPFATGCFFAPETPAYREESGCWTITA